MLEPNLGECREIDGRGRKTRARKIVKRIEIERDREREREREKERALAKPSPFEISARTGLD